MRTVFIECDRPLSRDEHRAMLENVKYEAGDDVRIVLLAPGMRVAEPASQWIPVSERLPEWKDHKNGVVLACYGNGAICFNCYMEGCWVQGNPVAWMPLPEPYREENK